MKKYAAFRIFSTFKVLSMYLYIRVSMSIQSWPLDINSSWMKFFEFRSRIDQKIQRKDRPESSSGQKRVRPKRFYCSFSNLCFIYKRISVLPREEDLLIETNRLMVISSTAKWCRFQIISSLFNYSFTLAMQLYWRSFEAMPSPSYARPLATVLPLSCDDNNDDISDQRLIIGLNLYNGGRITAV